MIRACWPMLSGALGAACLPLPWALVITVPAGVGTGLLIARSL